MKRVMVGLVIAGFALGAAGLLLWPRSKVSAQITPQLSAEGCSCSRPTVIGTGREQLSLYYCACPGMQCTVVATAAGSALPPNITQVCRTDTSQVLGPR
jgi:hypothetical protein